MGWIVKINGQEFPAASLEQLMEWRANGRIQDNHYVFNPTLQRWQLASEVPELQMVRPGKVAAPPKKSGLGKLLLLGCGGFLILAVIAGIVGSMKSDSSSSSSSVPAVDTAMQQQRSQKAEKQLAALPASADLASVAVLCEQIDFNAADAAPYSARCSAAHVSLAKSALDDGKLPAARRAFDFASREHATGTDDLKARLEKAEAADATKRGAKDAANRELAGQVLRIAYGKQLRQQYLDNNLDIKVTVTGKHDDHITLQFALFNDVWANKISKGTLLEEMKDKGFTRVDMTDGYNYHVSWDLTK